MYTLQRNAKIFTIVDNKISLLTPLYVTTKKMTRHYISETTAEDHINVCLLLDSNTEHSAHRESMMIVYSS